MSRELAILELADYYERVEYKDASAYLIINEKMEDYKCLFGFIEFPNDLETARGLFELLENGARAKGYKTLVGPVNYCTWMSYRWAINNFDMKLFPDCTNPAYYPKIIRQLGYKELFTYRSAHIDINNPLYAMGNAMVEQKIKEGFEFRLFENDDVFALSREVYDISTDAFKGSHLYSEIPYEYFKEVYLTWVKGLKIGMFVAYYKGEPVGYVFGYDNPYDHSFISKTSAVKKEYQKHKVYVALLYLGCKYVLDKGYKDMVYHFQCEQKGTFKRFDQSVESMEKRYAVFAKELD